MAGNHGDVYRDACYSPGIRQAHKWCRLSVTYYGLFWDERRSFVALRLRLHAFIVSQPLMRYKNPVKSTPISARSENKRARRTVRCTKCESTTRGYDWGAAAVNVQTDSLACKRHQEPGAPVEEGGNGENWLLVQQEPGGNLDRAEDAVKTERERLGRGRPALESKPSDQEDDLKKRKKFIGRLYKEGWEWHTISADTTPGDQPFTEALGRLH